MRIPSQKVILVDYFDTCARRDVSVDEMKRIWGREVSKKLKHSIPSMELVSIRLMVEHNIAIAGEDSYYNFDTLSGIIYDRISSENNHVIHKEGFIKISREIEETIETQHQYINKQLISMLQEAKHKGHYIVLISDFYLGKDSFALFLEELQLSDCFDRIYVSCDYMESKSNGNLYRIVLDELLNERIVDKNSSTIMIGDNYISDYLNSKKNGINEAYHYKWKKKPIDNSMDNIFKSLFHDGEMLSNYVFSLYLFCDRLYAQCIEEKINKVYFFSREGQFLKKLFDYYLLNKSSIVTNYLYVSRNSTFLPSLKSIEHENFSRLLNQYNNKISIRTFLKNLHFSDSEIRAFNFSDEEISSDIKDSLHYKAIIEDISFKRLYEEKRVLAKKCFVGYLEEKGIVPGSNIRVIDVGWKGTMQDNIWSTFEGKVKIDGYYLGLVSPGEMHNDSRKRGLLFDYVNYNGCSEISSDIFSYNSFLYEMILVANHGKTIDYSLEYQPIIYDDDDIKMYNLYAREIQNAVLEKFQIICKHKEDNLLDGIEIKLFEHYHGKMFKELKLHDLLYLDEMVLLHRDGFGNKESAESHGNKVKRILKSKMRTTIKMKGYYISKNGIKKW